MTNLSTEPYKGVRDFYPDDMAVQQYIFDVWSKTAESFGFQQYEASVLEPSDLYKAKGAENEEMVNDQTYTFTDRGEREVTLRPEMTPTVARMIAGRRKELAFPTRWYSIPNLFRYERTQRGRLREHWQLNCDIFGSDAVAADVETIALAYKILMNFGADESMFAIKINNRTALNDYLEDAGITDAETVRKITSLLDRKLKMSEADFDKELAEIAGADFKLSDDEPESVKQVREGLAALGITNVAYEPAIVRGFNYYTGTVFEVFDTSGENNRAMLGGGRYDNLTALFGDDPICGVGFGMGDVTMRDFLETHNLLRLAKQSAQMVVVPTEEKFNIEAEKVAMSFREAGLSVVVDISTKKLGKKMSATANTTASYVLVVGEDEVAREEYVVKNLADGTESSGTIDDLTKQFSV